VGIFCPLKVRWVYLSRRFPLFRYSETRWSMGPQRVERVEWPFPREQFLNKESEAGVRADARNVDPTPQGECVIEGLRGLEKCGLVKYLLPTPPSDLKNPTGKPR
jgi:hypothetical protein